MRRLYDPEPVVHTRKHNVFEKFNAIFLDVLREICETDRVFFVDFLEFAKNRSREVYFTMVLTLDWSRLPLRLDHEFREIMRSSGGNRELMAMLSQTYNASKQGHRILQLQEEMSQMRNTFMEELKHRSIPHADELNQLKTKQENMMKQIIEYKEENASLKTELSSIRRTQHFYLFLNILMLIIVLVMAGPRSSVKDLASNLRDTVMAYFDAL